MSTSPPAPIPTPTAPSPKKDVWDPNFYNRFAGFLAQKDWLGARVKLGNRFPTIQDYQAWYPLLQPNNAYQLDFCLQTADMDYLKVACTQKIIPTRENCWHDFFNFLSYTQFPVSKWAILKAHLGETKNLASQQRTPKQQALTQWDESGAFIVSSCPKILQFIQDFNWPAVFQAPNLLATTRCYLYGHGLMERCLTPFIGLTAKGLLVKVEEKFLQQPLNTQWQELDNLTAKWFQESPLLTPKNLQPFPLLGWPTWAPCGQDNAFYQNQQYFRPKPHSRLHIEATQLTV